MSSSNEKVILWLNSVHLMEVCLIAFTAECVIQKKRLHYSQDSGSKRGHSFDCSQKSTVARYNWLPAIRVMQAKVGKGSPGYNCQLACKIQVVTIEKCTSPLISSRWSVMCSVTCMCDAGLGRASASPGEQEKIRSKRLAGHLLLSRKQKTA